MKKQLILFVVLLFVISGCAGRHEAGENPVGRMLDDSTITTRINHEMLKDDIVKARQIDVDTIGGHVTLTGSRRYPGRIRPRFTNRSSCAGSKVRHE